MSARKNLATFVILVIAAALTSMLTGGIAWADEQQASGSKVTVAPCAAQVEPVTQPGTASVWVDTGDESVEYNENGFVAKHTFESFGGMRGDGTVVESFKYGKKGNLSKWVCKFTKKGASKTTATYTITFKYDKKGRLTRAKYRQSSGYSYKTVYRYSKGGRTVKSTTTDGDDVKVKRTYKISKSGRITKMNSVIYSRLNTYDMATGKLIEYGKWTKSNKEKISYAYDSHGNIRKESGRSVSGKKIKTIYKNTYDENGNLAECSPSGGLYSFESISVPAKYASEVTKQQRELHNPSLYQPYYSSVGYLHENFLSPEWHE